MSLIETLPETLHGEPASFQLMGEDLALVSGARLAAAGRDYEEGLARLPEGVRSAFEAEASTLLEEAHGWLRRYNKSVHARIAGYVALARKCGFEYPWPVVAVLGICQVLTGMDRNRLYGFAAPRLARIGFDALERLVDRTEDVLRRTNRGIFADSVPTVLWGLRVHALRRSGDEALADALLSGPLPPIFDEESRSLARALDEGLSLRDEAARFVRLSELTLTHFGREQAIFTHHLGARATAAEPSSPQAGLLRRLFAMRKVPAPVVVRAGRRRRVEFRDFPLPRTFDMLNHAARVELFGQAFVRSVTRDEADYREAVAYVLRRFGR